MSIEPDTNKPKDGFLSAQKLDALRDMLANHKPVKIKPVNIELKHQLAAMKLSYEKSVKEKPQGQADVPHKVVMTNKTQPFGSIRPMAGKF